MTKARTVTAADGVQTLFPVSFALPPQQGRAGVNVYVRPSTDAHPGVAKTVGVDFVWVSDGQVSFNAGHVPPVGTVVDIRRATLDTALDNIIQPGGSLRAADLVQNDDQLLYLIQEREDMDDDLQGQVDTETAARILNDNTLVAADAAEAATRAAGDNALAASLTAESNARSAADGVLQNNITAEATTRAAGDATLQGSINTETAQRVGADTGLQGQVNSLLAQLSAILSSLGSTVALTSLPLVALSMPALQALDTSHALPALYVEDGKSGIFALKAIDAAKIAADPTKIIYAASTTDVTKMWVRQHEGRINVTWAGAKLDNVTNDGAAIRAAQQLADALYIPNTLGYGHGAAMPLYFPFGVAYMGATQLNPLNSTKWSGNFGYDASSPVSGLRWDDNVCGVVTDNGGFYPEGLAFYGGYTNGANNGNYPAIWASKRMLAVRCAFYNWRGSGLKYDCTKTSGNMNDAGAMWCVFQNVMDAVEVIAGGDNSAMNFYACNVLTSRRFGINDPTFLGNTHTAHQFQNCGMDTSNDGLVNAACMCSSGGNRYMVIDPVNASTNAPTGTTADNAYWAYVSAGGAFTGCPLWFNGMLTQIGGPIYMPNINGPSHISGVYREGGQPLGWISQPAIVVGGNLSVAGCWKGQAGILNAAACLSTNGALKSTKPFRHDPASVTDENMTVQLSESNGQKTTLYLSGSVTFPSVLRQKISNGDLITDYAADTTPRRMLTGPTTTQQFGRSAPVTFANYFKDLMVGASAANARNITNGVAAPTTGNWAQGDTCWNRTCAVGQPKGWMCTVAGTPGTWVSMGNL